MQKLTDKSRSKRHYVFSGDDRVRRGTIFKHASATKNIRIDVKITRSTVTTNQEASAKNKRKYKKSEAKYHVIVNM